MTGWQLLAVLASGVGAGALNAVVGAGTLISFPVLLAIGLPAVSANATNTVGLVPGSTAAALGYRQELVGRGPLLLRLLAPALLGGLTGGALLLVLPGRAFEVIVPMLLLLAGGLVAIQPWLAARLATRRGDAALPAHGGALVQLGLFGTAVYGGYFGAAQGVLMLALFGVALGTSLQIANGLKNTLAAVINLTAAVLFAIAADVRWAAAGALAVGATLGGTLGSRFGRRLPDNVLRILVVALALGVAGWRLAAA